MRLKEMIDWTAADFVEKFKQDVLKCPGCTLNNELFRQLSEHPSFEVVAYDPQVPMAYDPQVPLPGYTRPKAIKTNKSSRNKWYLTSWIPNSANDSTRILQEGYDVGKLSAFPDPKKHLYLVYYTSDNYVVRLSLGRRPGVRLEGHPRQQKAAFFGRDDVVGQPPSFGFRRNIAWSHHYRVQPKVSWDKYSEGAWHDRFINWSEDPFEDVKE